MSLWKLLVVPLLVLVPLAAYIAGSLASSGDGPHQQDPIILEERGSSPDDGAGKRDRRDDDTRSGRRGDGSPGGGQNDPDDQDDQDDLDDAEGGVKVVLPGPTRVDDDDDEADDDDSRERD